MKIVERKTEYTNRKKLRKIEERGEEIIVDMEDYEGDISEPGTKLNACLFKKINGREDESLEFKKQDNNSIPASIIDTTQIITTNEGNVYVIPAGNEKTPISITEGSKIDTSLFETVNKREDQSLEFKRLTNNLIPDSKLDTTQIITTAAGEVWVIPAGINNEKIKLENVGPLITELENRLSNIQTASSKISYDNNISVQTLSDQIRASFKNSSGQENYLKLDQATFDINSTGGRIRSTSGGNLEILPESKLKISRKSTANEKVEVNMLLESQALKINRVNTLGDTINNFLTISNYGDTDFYIPQGQKFSLNKPSGYNVFQYENGTKPRVVLDLEMNGEEYIQIGRNKTDVIKIEKTRTCIRDDELRIQNSDSKSYLYFRRTNGNNNATMENCWMSVRNSEIPTEIGVVINNTGIYKIANPNTAVETRNVSGADSVVWKSEINSLIPNTNPLENGGTINGNLNIKGGLNLNYSNGNNLKFGNTDSVSLCETSNTILEIKATTLNLKTTSLKRQNASGTALGSIPHARYDSSTKTLYLRDDSTTA